MENQKLVTTFNVAYNQLANIMPDFFSIIRVYSLVLFSGEMGAGKTTFIRHLCQYLGVGDHVSSPTFSIINEYQYFDGLGTRNKIYHIDLYRLNSTTEAINAGIEDCINQAIANKQLVFIEWPERALELLPKPYLWVEINNIIETEREIKVFSRDRLQ